MKTIGRSPLTLELENLMESGEHARALDQAWSALQKRFQTDVGFYPLPHDPKLSFLSEVTRAADQFTGFDDCLFLGIGGSALGPASALAALSHRAQAKPRFHFLDNPDPTAWRQTLAQLAPDHTLVCAVTKSGSTFETLAQTILAMEWLGKTRWKKHLIAITDPEKGDLLKVAQQENLTVLPIAPSIGGRFSIFSPVGTFPLALAGLDPKSFLLGASDILDSLSADEIADHPLGLWAAGLLARQKTHPVHVCMPYSASLLRVADWWVQLWGESLGKDEQGFTPVAACGPTDQHSILQLLRDGPNDKITFFLQVEALEDPVAIPRLPELSPYPSFHLLEGHSLKELIDTELYATNRVLTGRGRPTMIMRLRNLDERSLGATYFAFAVLTSLMGGAMGVNPFDQPGVEEGKVYIKKSLQSRS